ncbi:MAG: serine--tRNA ligase, partial [Erysipelotrichaceae bacterium]|nr:serine--tRNA ligase [Erysipelotrichaceae bacterium]
MIDIKLIRENPDLVKENIRKKFQDEKLVLVDEVKKLDEEYRAVRVKADELRAQRNSTSKEIGGLMKQGLKEEAEKAKAAVTQIGKDIEDCEAKELEYEEEIRKRMLVIP